MENRNDIGASRLALFALMLSSFALGTEAYAYAGHLESLTRDLGVSLAAGGLPAAAFAIACAAAGPPLAVATSRTDRRRLILFGLAALGLLDLLAALVPNLALLIALRILCGLAAALVGPTASAAAAMLVPPAQRGRAMAVVLGGMTLAFILGIPLGSVIGGWAGWRACFVFAGIVCGAAALAVLVLLPRLPGSDGSRRPALLEVLEPTTLRVLLLTLLGFAATFTVIAYIGPIAAHIADLHGAEVGALQALIGVGSIIGVVIGARLADRPSAMTMVTASFALSALALSAYSLLPLSGLPQKLLIGLLALAMVAGAAALFARTPAIQARLVALAPERSAVLLALNGSTVFIGQGLGALFGALATALFGLGALGFAAAGVAVLGLLVARRALRHDQAASSAASATAPAQA